MSGLDYRNIPIVINSFNREDCLRRLVSWLRTAKYENIIIVDNASTYPPLLRYLDNLSTKREIRIVRLPTNLGPYAVWDAALLPALGIDSEYVYTDPDIVPCDFCPHDVIRVLQSVLSCDSRISKVGLGLRLDDIPACFQDRDMVLAWERQYWLRPCAPGLYSAAIDTTFAIYRAGTAGYMNEGTVRTGWPYLASHEGWYLDSGNPTEEDRFYRKTADSEASTWLAPQRPDWLIEESRRFAAEHPVVLHLGAGPEILPGYINIGDNADPAIAFDIRFDLDNCAREPLPLPADTVDGIYACHFLQRINDPLALMQELHRVAKPNAKFILRVPHGASDNAYENSASRRPYFSGSFSCFAQPARSRAECGYKGDWDIESIKFVLDSKFETMPHDELRRMVDSQRNAVSEIVVQLRAVKPARRSGAELRNCPPPEFAFTPLDLTAGFERV